jgi:hypothetical protein
MIAQAGSLEKQLLRSQYAEIVATALVKAAKLNDKATLANLDSDVERQFYRQIAQSAVMLVSDRILRHAADYYASEAYQRAMEYPALRWLGLTQRVNRVTCMREAIKAWLSFLRGQYPLSTEQYKKLAQADREQMAANNQELS